MKCTAAALLAAACTPAAKLEVTLESAPSSEVVMKLLNVNQYEVLDTLKTDASGRFSYKVNIEKDQPEFVYVYYNDKRVESLLLEAGEGILQPHILHGGKFGEQAQVLEKHAERTLADVHPLLDAEVADIVAIEGDDALVIIAIAIDVAAERRFARAECSLYLIEMPALELHILVPHIGVDVILSRKDFGKGMV